MLRHAPGAELHVTLRLRDGELLVELRDTGAGPAGTPAGAGAGLGLVGLHERVAEAGGRLEAGPATGGWRLRARAAPQGGRAHPRRVRGRSPRGAMTRGGAAG